MAYGMWMDVLRSLLGVTLDSTPAQVDEVLRQQVLRLCRDEFDDVYPYVARLMALPLEQELVSKLDNTDGADLKASTFRAMETLMQSATRERPLALVCEDLHWADQASIELLEQLLALTDRAALLFICVLRPRKEHGSWRIKEAAARTYGHRHTDLWLQPLSASESGVLVGNLLRVEDLHVTLKQRILDAAEGNPFYVEEILRSMIDQGAIVRDDATGRWQATESAVDIPIPDTLQGVLLGRIDRLQEETKRVLQMASVIGRIFLYRVLAAIAGEERGLDEHLLTLQREEMIRERARIPELEYIFKHELTREAAFNSLLKKERRVFHGQVAEALERLFPQRIEEQLGLLAYHWERAGNAEKATKYLLRAGDKAREAYACAESIDYYQRALEFLQTQEEHERTARTLMKLGLTHHIAFQYPQAREAYEDGFVLWQRAAQARQEAPLVDAPHPLRVHWPDQSLDPAVACDLQEVVLTRHLFSGLVRLSPEMDIVPDVARSWEVLAGGREYVFHLREDVRWSDGTIVTAEDFEYAWKRVLHPATGSAAADLLYDVRGAKAFHRGVISDHSDVSMHAVDEHTLVVELEGPTAYFLHLLAYTPLFAVPRHVVELHGDSWTDLGNIATNGPFRLEATRPGESFLLVRNPEYHGQSAGNVQQVKLCLLWASPDAVEMYEANELDVLLLWGLALRNRARAMQRHAEEYMSMQAPAVTWGLEFDTSRPPFDDQRVRQALAMALDREPLEGMALRGSSYRATGGFLPGGMPGHSPGLVMGYDPEQARQLLADAGYPRGRGFPAVNAIASDRSGPFIEYLEAQWQETLQVEIAWKQLDWPSFERCRQSSHLCFDGWGAAYPDPHSLLGRPRFRERGRWRDVASDRLIEEAKCSTDQEERIKLYQLVDRRMIEAAAVIPLTYGRSHWLIKPWVKTYSSTLMGWFHWNELTIEPH